MKRFVEGVDRSQSTMFPDRLEDWIGADNPVLSRYEAVRERMYLCAERLGDCEKDPSITDVRVAVNDLLVRLAVATLIYSKGSGYIRQRDAQRLVREAMFFLVWSAPEEVRSLTMAGFLEQPLPESKSLAT